MVAVAFPGLSAQLSKRQRTYTPESKNAYTRGDEVGREGRGKGEEPNDSCIYTPIFDSYATASQTASRIVRWHMVA